MKKILKSIFVIENKIVYLMLLNNSKSKDGLGEDEVIKRSSHETACQDILCLNVELGLGLVAIKSASSCSMATNKQ